MSNVTTNYLDPRTGWFKQAHGANGRLFVEDGNSAFYEGRQFFTFHEFSIPVGESLVIKTVLQGDVIMRDFFVQLLVSNARVEIVTGGTTSGTFGTTLPVLRTNNMSITPTPAPLTVHTTGGTHTGGTVLDLFILNSGNNLNQAVGQQSGEGFPIGFPAGTYYTRVTNTGSAIATGIFKARYTEVA